MTTETQAPPVEAADLITPHMDRLITLLAWLSIVENPVECDRYCHRILMLRREHPELADIRQDDPRVETRAMELLNEIEDDDRRGDYSDVEEGWVGYR